MYRSCRPKMHLYSFRTCISLSRRSHALNLLILSSTRSGASPRLGSAQSAFQVASSNNPKIPLRHLIFICGLLLGVHVFSEWEVLSPVNAVSFLDIARNSPRHRTQAFTKSHKISLTPCGYPCSPYLRGPRCGLRCAARRAHPQIQVAQIETDSFIRELFSHLPAALSSRERSQRSTLRVHARLHRLLSRAETRRVRVLNLRMRGHDP